MKTLVACFLLVFLSFAGYGHGHCPQLARRHHGPCGPVVKHLGSLYLTESGSRQVWKAAPHGSFTTLASWLKKPENLMVDNDGRTHLSHAGMGVHKLQPLVEAHSGANQFHFPSGSVLDDQAIYSVYGNISLYQQFTAGP